ncbi:MAG: UDP-N-acetylglucosamine 4,6-dehydratase (inverting) [Euryarchaeota archaeon]|nr:UDP-N-acetylglucosamine 4,6-dehydratase (inverting) [Euryarchaeota archaeon]
MHYNKIVDKSILITGGTGSFGKAMVKELLQKHKCDKIIIYSRDELKQSEMMNYQWISEYKGETKIRFFIGDIRDKDRLKYAMYGVNYVFHAAALKQVPVAEYNPFECIKTNIIGGQNVIETALECGVEKVIALSTDKAASPRNLYGATKLCSDKLFIAANNFLGGRKINFSVVRYGNVMGSRGSVIPIFLEMQKKGKLTITDKRMTRFNITLNQAIKFTINSLMTMKGSEIFVPKIPSYNIMDLAKAINKNCKYEYVGLRPGEKLHEEMITELDSENAYEFNNYYMILPSKINGSGYLNYSQELNYIGKVKSGFCYNSKNNEEFLNVHELKSMINNI